MGYIFLGHGSLDVRAAGGIDPAMEIVAIPQGTTIQFYADAGQGLVYGSHQLDIWEQLEAPWPPIDSTGVTYNLTLENAKEFWDRELENDPGFGGHTLIRAGVDGVPDPILLCSGTTDTCPTDPRDVAAGATHTCDGILGTYSGDLYWLACTSFRGMDRQTKTAIQGGHSTAVGLGNDPDWLPTDADYDAIASVNGDNVKSTADGDSIDFVIGGFVMLIGDDHDPDYRRYARFQDDAIEGTLTVNKGGVFSSGSLDVSGVPAVKQGVVESAVARFSDKKINFV